MDFAPHVEYSDIVLYGAFVETKNYSMAKLVTISNLVKKSLKLGECGLFGMDPLIVLVLESIM